MSTTIQFLREPKYEESVVLFILAPAGISGDAESLGKNLFGSDAWEDESLFIEGLSPKQAFRYSDISIHWTDFLELAYQHVDHALFYVPHKQTYKEISKESLIHQNPDLYSFSFRKFTCEGHKRAEDEDAKAKAPAVPLHASAPARMVAERRDDRAPRNAPPDKEKKPSTASDSLEEAQQALHALLDTGWSGNSVSKHTGITTMTISGIRNGKSSQISRRVHSAIMDMKKDADAGHIQPPQYGAMTNATGRTAGEKKQPTPIPRQRMTAGIGVAHASPLPSAASHASDSLRKEQYVAVDAAKLEALIDHLCDLFTEGIEGLQEIRRRLSR